MNAKIKPRDRDAIIQALRAGVVPRLGLPHIQVGRLGEVREIVRDAERITGGGSSVRLIIGEYGSGKTFFLNLARAICLEHKLVVAQADLAPDRRLHASGGQARNLYAELMRNISTRSKPDGGGLSSIVERFIGEAKKEAENKGTSVDSAIRSRLAALQELVSGYDFAEVVSRYWRAFEDGDEHKKAAALRWLRGEYALKTEAREELGVRSIIDDSSTYDYLKLMSRFVRLAGYDGFVVILDEMVNLFKLVSAQARNGNYEQLLRIVNDVLQGSAEHIGFCFGGTPEFLMDTRRGLYSYEALRSRLAENSFARDGAVDFSGPVIRLQSLTRNDMHVLLMNLRQLFFSGEQERNLIDDAALESFLDHCDKKIGQAYFRTPRNTIKAFLDLLSILDQNPSLTWEHLLGEMVIGQDRAPVIEDIDDAGDSGKSGKDTARTAPAPDDEDLGTFRI